MKTASKILKITALIIVVITAISLLLGAGLITYAVFNVDAEADEILFQLAKEGNITEFYANGAPLGSDYYIPVKIDSASHVESGKVWYPLGEISDLLKRGFVAVEDREFYEHGGVNFRRTFAALLNSIFKFENRFGASTITQQTVKNISGDNEPTFRRKLNEILRAMTMEKNHTKDEIIELYMNIVPMGENTVGVGLASEIYFDKLPNELNPAECALLIGLANAPTKYNPYLNPEAAKEKRNSVLDTMLEHKIIGYEEWMEYKESEISINPRENHRNAVNSWFIETASRDIISDLKAKYHISEETAKKMLSGGGLTVYTTESVMIQNELESFFENTDNLPEEIKKGLEYGAVIIDSVNGNLLGIIGRAGEKQGEWLINHATVPHIPASALKPLALYAPAIDKGLINWATVLDDVPVEFIAQGTELYEYPKNSPNRYDGLVTVKRALAVSKNTAAVRLYKMLGKDSIYDFLKRRLGMNTLVESMKDSNGNFYTDKSTAPLALGQLTLGVPLRTLTSAYTVFPAGGELNKNRSYIKVLDRDNNILLENNASKTRIFSKSTSQIMNQLLSAVTDEGTAKSITLKNVIDTAGKTGTSSLNRDKVFVGYTPYVTFGIWSGYDNSQNSLDSTSPSHLEIWDKIANRIHLNILADISDEHVKHFKKDMLVYLPYCRDSGKIYSEQCKYDPRGERIEYGYFSRENIPFGECDRHILVSFDSEKSEIVPYDPSNKILKTLSLIKTGNRDFPKDIFVSDSEYSLEMYIERQGLGNRDFILSLTHDPDKKKSIVVR